MILVHFKQNQGTSSGSFCKILYSEFEMSLHFIWIHKLQLEHNIALLLAEMFLWQMPQGKLLVDVIEMFWG